VTADNKSLTYGGTAPTYTFTPDGFVNGDTWLTGGTPTCTSAYSTTTPVSSSPVTISCSGGDAGGNYDVSYVDGELSIGQKSLTVSAAGVGRVYNGTNVATVNLSTTDVINSDVVNLNYTSATFDNKNVGVNKAISVTGISISGAGAGNYALQNTTASTSATVTVAPLTISAVTDSKTYDGTTDSNKTPTVSGIQTGDSVTGLDQVFDSANAGSRTLSVSAYTVNDGNSGNNYSVTTNTASGTIGAAGFTILYNGGTYFAPASVPTNITVSAQVNVATAACYTSGSGGIVTFTGTRLYGTGTGSDVFTQTFNITGSGTSRTASGSISLGAGLWDIRASYNAAGNCIPEPGGFAFDDAVVAVVGPGDSSNGGGWYRYDGGLSGSPKVNFGYTVGKTSSYNKRLNQTTTTWRGQILWSNNGQYRFKGQTFAQVVTSGTTPATGGPYGTTPCPTTFTSTLPSGTSGQQCGSFTGTGTLEQWDSATSTWVPTTYGTINFTANMYDSGSAKVCKGTGKKQTCTTSENFLDQFGIQYEQLPSSLIRESIPQVLKGGSLKVVP
jgi:hypothetical protein